MDVIAGDLGGTKTLLALCTVDGDRVTVRASERYLSAEASGLDALVARFVAAHGGRGLPACVGVAGPVVDDTCRVTNLPWTVEARALAAQLGAPARLLNDFEAVAWGVGCVEGDGLVTLHAGREVARAPRAVLGAGTGLGEAFCVWSGDGYVAWPTEGGHSDLAARNDEEDALLRDLRARHGHVSYERVVSGAGLVAVYEHLRALDPSEESAAVGKALAAGGDAAAVIGTRAAAGDDALAGRAFDLWAAVYGAEAGNLALKVLARGGVYVAGGIAAKLLPRLARSPFLDALHDKGRMRGLVASMPVRVITDERVGLLGAARCAATLRGFTGA